MSDAYNLSPLLREISDLLARHFSQAHSAQDIATGIQHLHSCAESWLEKHQNPVERKEIACGPGCGTCCAVNITVLFPEAVAIDHHLREHFSPEERADTLKRLSSLADEIRWLDDEERILLRRSCAFLNSAGSCSIYPVRPLLCRSVTSADAQSCQMAIVMQAFGESRPVLMNLFQKHLMESVFTRAGEDFHKSGRDPRGFNLTRTVYRLRKDPGITEAWLAGENLSL